MNEPTEANLKHQLLGIIARGWCSPANSHKEMDADLALAIADEVYAALSDRAVLAGKQYETDSGHQAQRSASNPEAVAVTPARLLAEAVLSMSLVTPQGVRARQLARDVLATDDALLRALRLIEHATAPTPDDEGHHEAAHDIAVMALAGASKQGD